MNHVVRAGLIVALRPYRQGIQILLIRRGLWNLEEKRPQKFPGEWVFPGGTTELKDNNILETAKREFREETGYEGVFSNIARFRTGSQESPGRTFFIEFFTASVDGKKPLHPDPHEVLDIAWMTPRQALRIATSKKFTQQQEHVINKHHLSDKKYGKHAVLARQHALQNIITMRHIVAKSKELKKIYG
jgi:8-oxo-dGTP pyrophosphatase MutT (NUDIX family)